MPNAPLAGPVELVIFDHDGVLVDSEIIAMDLCSRLLSEHGVPTTVDEAIRVYLGSSLDSVMDAIEHGGTAIDRVAFDQRFHDELFAGFRRELQPIPGMRLLLGLAGPPDAFSIRRAGLPCRLNGRAIYSFQSPHGPASWFR